MVKANVRYTDGTERDVEFINDMELQLFLYKEGDHVKDWSAVYD